MRYNDVWILNTSTRTWEKPIDGRTSPAPRDHEKNASPVPLPRGAHSSVLIGDIIFIFGGYGGMGWERRDFNDLFALNVNDYVWSRCQPSGHPPEPRSGHQACTVRHQVFIPNFFSPPFFFLVYNLFFVHLFKTVCSIKSLSCATLGGG